MGLTHVVLTIWLRTLHWTVFSPRVVVPNIANVNCRHGHCGTLTRAPLPTLWPATQRTGNVRTANKCEKFPNFTILCNASASWSGPISVKSRDFCHGWDSSTNVLEHCMHSVPGSRSTWLPMFGLATVGIDWKTYWLGHRKKHRCA